MPFVPFESVYNSDMAQIKTHCRTVTELLLFQDLEAQGKGLDWA